MAVAQWAEHLLNLHKVLGLLSGILHLTGFQIGDDVEDQRPLRPAANPSRQS